MLGFLVLALLLVPSGVLNAQSRNLELYWIDVEGGAATFEETADCKGNWITTSVARDGKFTIVNGRNGFSQTYTAR
jgi:hypothetical protein